MRVSIRYLAQLRQAAGRASEDIELKEACSAREFVVRQACCHGDALRQLLLKGKEKLQPTILLFVGDEQVGPEDQTPLKDGDVITVLTPIAGG